MTDSGVGIAPEDQATVFEEFRQVGATAQNVEGTGLGLAISRKFIELHGGRIWVASEVGKGSTFAFTVPLISDRCVKLPDTMKGRSDAVRDAGLISPRHERSGRRHFH